MARRGKGEVGGFTLDSSAESRHIGGMLWGHRVLVGLLFALLSGASLRAQTSGDGPPDGGPDHNPPAGPQVNVPDSPPIQQPGFALFTLDISNPSAAVLTVTVAGSNGIPSSVPLQSGIDLVGFFQTSRTTPSISVISSNLAFVSDSSLVFTSASPDSLTAPSADLHLFGDSTTSMPFEDGEPSFSGQMILDLSAIDLSGLYSGGYIDLGDSASPVTNGGLPVEIGEWTVVPEPSSAFLLPPGAAVAFLFRRRLRTA